MKKQISNALQQLQNKKNVQILSKSQSAKVKGGEDKEDTIVEEEILNG